MSDYTLVDDEDVPEGTIIPEDGWALKVRDAIVVINWIKFADEENEDGTYNVDIDWECVEGDHFPEMETLIGNACMAMLEDAMKVRAMKEAIKEAEDARK
jgi:hypothetical protein